MMKTKASGIASEKLSDAKAVKAVELRDQDMDGVHGGSLCNNEVIKGIKGGNNEAPSPGTVEVEDVKPVSGLDLGSTRQK
ncbi:MAG: hypothetical protein KDJ47_13950 [Hyphomicrobiaceae bacterium]|nr:hypothetical protein [Hyphomicrobiaceae bacterium]